MNERIEETLYKILESDHHAAEDRCRAAALLVESLGMLPPVEEHDHAEPERQVHGVTMTAYQLMELRRYIRSAVRFDVLASLEGNSRDVDEAEARLHAATDATNEAFNIWEKQS